MPWSRGPAAIVPIADTLRGCRSILDGVSDFPSYFRRILLQGMTPNGVFGSKMMWGYLRELVPQLSALLAIEDSSLPAVLAAAFRQVRYIWLTRRDKVRQGISFYRALETKVWRSTDVPAGLADNPPFDFLAIDRLVQLSTWEAKAGGNTFSNTPSRHSSSPTRTSPRRPRMSCSRSSPTWVFLLRGCRTTPGDISGKRMRSPINGPSATTLSRAVDRV